MVKIPCFLTPPCTLHLLNLPPAVLAHRRGRSVVSPFGSGSAWLRPSLAGRIPLQREKTAVVKTQRFKMSVLRCPLSVVLLSCSPFSAFQYLKLSVPRPPVLALLSSFASVNFPQSVSIRVHPRLKIQRFSFHRFQKARPDGLTTMLAKRLPKFPPAVAVFLQLHFVAGVEFDPPECPLRHA